jgi:hypothetical protein
MIGAIGVRSERRTVPPKASISRGNVPNAPSTRFFEQVRSPLTRLFEVHEGEIEMNERVRIEMFLSGQAAPSVSPSEREQAFLQVAP